MKDTALLNTLITSIIIVVISALGYIATLLQKAKKKLEKIDSATNDNSPGELPLNKKVKKLGERMTLIEAKQIVNHQETQTELRKLSSKLDGFIIGLAGKSLVDDANKK